jgi:phosphoribosylaminoimidazolecarboxamide formyltransferase/IMP cyclohydrolase
MPEPVIRRALISVSDKTGLVEFVRYLAGRGVEILSTGGTAKSLREAGLAVVEVSDHTGFPEIMDGRVKTLHPKIHGGILAVRDNPDHERAMREQGIAPIDMVVVNLYPFEATVAKGGDFEQCIENIDIGGPALIRAAAKNHAHVVVLTDPEDYARVMTEMTNHDGATGTGLRRRLAAAAFARCGAYDGAIGAWFAERNGEHFPRYLAVGAKLSQSLRYGENPHQRGALYITGEKRPGVATARQLQGKELSFNNINDTDAAYELVSEFKEPAVAIIKHANPCGVATAADLATAYRHALACDPVSAFGGVIALNRTLDGATAAEIAKLFTEVVIAPDAEPEAIAAFARKKNLRLLLAGGLPDPSRPAMTLRSVAGGILAQGRDLGRVMAASLRVVTERAPTEAELADMMFGFVVCKHVKSNAIVYAKQGATVGIGAGQMSRVDSARIAAWKAREAGEQAGQKEAPTVGSIVASDAFFPFADGLIAAAEAGATAVIQPGGSVRDEDVIAEANKRGLAMVFTGLRHFRH